MRDRHTPAFDAWLADRRAAYPVSGPPRTGPTVLQRAVHSDGLTLDVFAVAEDFDDAEVMEAFRDKLGTRERGTWQVRLIWEGNGWVIGSTSRIK